MEKLKLAGAKLERYKDPSHGNGSHVHAVSLWNAGKNL